MTKPPLDPKERQRRLDAVARFQPTGLGWAARAARALEMNPVTFRSWLQKENIRASDIDATPPEIIAPVEPEEPLAMRQERKLKDEITALKREVKKAH